ncbi:GH25 family lysozyme [Alterisphingorhabdus coralli]|uniref:GH25 family lysozyme n=1 Tax=Alterisphingorhabdus coralli TaxID=3071408 RepID=A0AA97F8M9_9SPHN|nr:GH25 family lysozyme [Parasphingorhabdus sp. SCSIO 66989]WOE75946.1 GH25 family lysozyme [Parasphingorhabdus sp. SCSIO 66989]
MVQGRKSVRNWLIIIISVLLALTGLIWTGFSMARSWTPSREDYPLQGVTVSAESGTISWRALAAQGVGFGYIEATRGANQRDPRFIENYRKARTSDIGFAPLHHYDLCSLASDQAQNFVTTVPRNDKAMPAAIALDFSEDCTTRPTEALVISEMITFLNQIEGHMGKRAVLRISPEFESEYQISAAISREIWLTGNYFAPEYASRPWTLWTANDHYSMDGASGPIGWNVVQPASGTDPQSETTKDSVPDAD